MSPLVRKALSSQLRDALDAMAAARQINAWLLDTSGDALRYRVTGIDGHSEFLTPGEAMDLCNECGHAVSFGATT